MQDGTERHSLSLSLPLSLSLFVTGLSRTGYHELAGHLNYGLQVTKARSILCTIKTSEALAKSTSTPAMLGGGDLLR